MEGLFWGWGRVAPLRLPGAGPLAFPPVRRQPSCPRPTPTWAHGQLRLSSGRPCQTGLESESRSGEAARGSGFALIELVSHWRGMRGDGYVGSEWSGLARSRRSGRQRRGYGCISTTRVGRSQGASAGSAPRLPQSWNLLFWLALQLPDCCRGWLSGFQPPGCSRAGALGVSV